MSFFLGLKTVSRGAGRDQKSLPIGRAVNSTALAAVDRPTRVKKSEITRTRLSLNQRRRSSSSSTRPSELDRRTSPTSALGEHELGRVIDNDLKICYVRNRTTKMSGLKKWQEAKSFRRFEAGERLDRGQGAHSARQRKGRCQSGLRELQAVSYPPDSGPGTSKGKNGSPPATRDRPAPLKGLKGSTSSSRAGSRALKLEKEAEHGRPRACPRISRRSRRGIRGRACSRRCPEPRRPRRRSFSRRCRAPRASTRRT